MKLLILYTSKTGSTKQYAQWLHEEFSESDLFDLNNFDFEKVKDYDLIIIGSPVLGGMFLSTEVLMKHVEKLKDKKVFLMGVGAVPESEKWSIKSYNRIPKPLRDIFVGYIKLPGISGEPKGFGKFLYKFILGVNINNLVIQQEVKREDLDRVVEWVRGNIK